MISSSRAGSTSRARFALPPWAGPLAFMLVAGIYAVVRFSGQWAEADSATFARVVRTFIGEGKLVSSAEPVYPNGYAFQVLSAYIVALTGLDVASIQQVIYPLTAAVVVLPAWVLYRELTESARGATLATLLLMTQPEFLFVVLRSSHEKFTRTLMLVLLFLLLRSFRLRGRPVLLASHVVAFHLAAFALIVSNNLIAHSFMIAVAGAVALAALLRRRSPALMEQSGAALRRLPYTVFGFLVLIYLVTFFVYSPAQHDLLVLRNMGERIAALLLDVQKTGGQSATNPYAQVQLAWISVSAYLLVSIANWGVLVSSFIIWAAQGIRWLFRGVAPATRAAQLMWLLYTSFAIQGVLSILSDASGVLGSNLQHRIFPSFSIMAVALVGAALAGWQPPRLSRLVQPVLALLLSVVAILSIMKATNEPLVSNKWTFYQPAEMEAIMWGDAHLKDAEIWTEFDERLLVAFDTAAGGSRNGNELTAWSLRDSTRNVLITEVTRLRSLRLMLPLPVPPNAFRVFDNGEAALYHRRPETPYQP